MTTVDNNAAQDRRFRIREMRIREIRIRTEHARFVTEMEKTNHGLIVYARLMDLADTDETDDDAGGEITEDDDDTDDAEEEDRTGDDDDRVTVSDVLLAFVVRRIVPLHRLVARSTMQVLEAKAAELYRAAHGGSGPPTHTAYDDDGEKAGAVHVYREHDRPILRRAVRDVFF